MEMKRKDCQLHVKHNCMSIKMLNYREKRQMKKEKDKYHKVCVSYGTVH